MCFLFAAGRNKKGPVSTDGDRSVSIATGPDALTSAPSGSLSVVVLQTTIPRISQLQLLKIALTILNRGAILLQNLKDCSFFTPFLNLRRSMFGVDLFSFETWIL